MKEKYILGLDLGITSVGYGIINFETKKIIDAGVRLFPEANVDNNEGRRSKRGSRRLKRRRIHRLDRVKSLLTEYNLINREQIPTSNNPYQIRVKGLSEILSKDELAIALLHLAKRRGIHNINVSSEDEDASNELSTKEQINRNNKLLKNKYVCEVQLQRLKEGQIRGEKNRFKTTDILKEIDQLLKVQKDYHNLDIDFINQYKEIVETRREYFEGPGQGSPFGWNGDLKKWYEMLMGHCTYFPQELRSVKYAYSADLFNALNDLNNLIIQRNDSEKLEYHEKYHIIENVFKQKKKPTLKQIAKEIGVNPEDIKGYRITKSGTPQFTEFKLYHDLKSIVFDKSILENEAILDQIAEILTIYQDEESIKEELNKLPEILNEQDKAEIAKLTGYNGTHRLSLKCIHLINEELWQTSRNQMEIFNYLNIKPNKVDLSEQNKIPKDLVDEFILSPVVKRTFIQSINVINKVIEKYGIPEDIIIELARENNSDDRKKFINNLQKKNEATRKRINEIIGQTGNQNGKRIVEKIRLHDQQEGKCLYSLESIPLMDLLNNPQNYEVDHIIPRSVAFDNSIHNKVLVKQIENSKKGNRTPYQYLNSSDANLSYNQFKQHILNLSKSKDRISKKKKDYLLEERDINKFEVQKEFINRNLVDTRYATRELTSYLKAYFSANNMDVKVKTINGSFTNHLRKVWRFDKYRNHGYKHHAEDALIIANADFLFKENKKLQNANKILEKPTIENDTQKVTVEKEEDYNNMFETPKLVEDIKQYRDYKFSHRVDKKPNRQLIKDTLYSTRMKDEHNYIVQTITDIYGKDNTNLKKQFNKNPEKFLMYQNDPKTFEKLSIIMKQYSDEKNPLAKYYEETGEYLTKYSKKNNGPIVKKIKLLGNKVGNHLDVTNKYENSTKKLVKLSIKNYRFDVYLTEKGYKFVTIAYLNVFKKDNYYYIPKDLYQELKAKKKIKDTDQFIASFYKNDLIKLNGDLYKIIGVNSDDRNIIELDYYDIKYKDYCEINNIKGEPRIKKTIGKKTESIEKLTTDVLGNLYLHTTEKAPQLIFKRGL
ncbi:type II CRISPR RNA-guided endonuclease Cas9 [Staphylococcus warneri]|uniref:type II CRISPR RNA-guided endonuclease Cas9 n=1 Tax=Staphylococcus warneri TaxID=1292 RepID=UPI000736D766|nr:type II CRISPR RNA-guided endonuclease Cas9 [Staphylococcus warneri]AXZ22286.1 type II CRISPR RNA-guided endonuclease Cas9 [Staphylococcus warneri]KTW04760.1 CRISPR-associated protein Cas9 [Staphylococcus warneri]OIS42290.1 type II CRISPR RNA-guided endonuclease Cas9 [Staphylococcus warneri]OIS45856.1 type II CRISPR RNA-guided endonuclease Cas9 [Staphylococcus warneri]PTI07747.1 type II CRISPR RNA-guided endonuclease Cas9 [Staphylococcus warneri]